MSFKQINVAGVDFALFEDFGVFPATIDAESYSIIECAEQKVFLKLIVCSSDFISFYFEIMCNSNQDLRICFIYHV